MAITMLGIDGIPLAFGVHHFPYQYINFYDVSTKAGYKITRYR